MHFQKKRNQLRCALCRSPWIASGINGASKIMVVDYPDRVKIAEKIVAIPVDDSDGASADGILEMTGGGGADRGCEYVGYQCGCKDPELPDLAMNNLLEAVRPTGEIGVVVFVAEDPRAEDELENKADWRSISADFGRRASKSRPAS
jgi:threonine dehydrogenase-like Zn-dependent dehydrogenase